MRATGIAMIKLSQSSLAGAWLSLAIKTWLKNEENLQNEDDLKNEEGIKIEADLKSEADLENEENHKKKTISCFVCTQLA